MNHLPEITAGDGNTVRGTSKHRRVAWIVLVLVLAIGVPAGIYLGQQKLGASPQLEVAVAQSRASVDIEPNNLPRAEPLGREEDAKPVSEEDSWSVVTNSKTNDTYEGYLNKYPKEHDATVAREELSGMKPDAPSEEMTPRSPPQASLEPGSSKVPTEPVSPKGKGNDGSSKLPESSPPIPGSLKAPHNTPTVQNKSTVPPAKAESPSSVSTNTNQTDPRYRTQGFANLNSLPIGSAAVSAPVKAEVGESFIVYLRVSPSDVPTLKKSLEHDLPENVVGDTKSGVKFSEYMIAHLRGSGFSVQPLTEEIQAVSLTGPTTWQWEVTSGMFGTRTLSFTLSCYLLVNNNEKPHECYSYHLKMKVAVKPWPFLRQYWQWIVTTILLPLVGWSWAFYKQSKTPEKAQPNLANKVRERIRRRKLKESG